MLSAKPWRGETVLLFCGAQVFCLFFSLILAGLLHKAGFIAFQAPDGFGAVLLSTLGFQGVTWVLIPIFLRHHQLSCRETFGFHRGQWQRTLFMVGGITLAILPVVWGLQFISAGVLTRIGWPPEEEQAVALLANAKFWWMRVYLGIFAVVLAPVAEEFTFRGLLYPFVKQLGYPRLAWVGVSLAFALIHVDAAGFVSLFVLALALTWLYEKTGDLLAPIAAHALFNAVNLVLLSFQDPLNQFLERLSHTLPHA